MIRRPDVGGVGEAVSAVATNAGPKTGQPAPDFTWRTSDGATHSLKDYQGKAVLVNFWGTWCPPCRRELPDIVKLRNELGPQGFEVIGVCLENVPNPAEHVAKFAKANGLEYPLIIANGDVERAYGGIEAVPTSFFVNRQGVITDKLVGGGNEATFRSKIKKAM
jgi:peroxiredoxin